MKLGGLNKEDLLKKVISLEFERLLGAYRNGEEIIEKVSDREENPRKSFRDKKEFKSAGKYTRLFINLGKSDGFYPEQLIDLVNTNTRGRKIPIGKIDLLKSFSFFEVEAGHADDLMGALNNSRFMKRKVAVEVAQEKTAKNGHRGFDRKKRFKVYDRN